jgi:8-oxo-dGTP pyrophosphatase MutT (NUDIX family)
MTKPWELLSSEIVYEKKWLKLKEDACRLPDGRVLSPYLVVDVPGFCNVFVVTEQEEVVLVKQYRHAGGIVSVEMPGGMVDPGEDPGVTVLRELREETGYSSDQVELLYTMHPNPPLESNKAWFYLARNAKPNQTIALDPFEDIQVVLVPKAEFMRMLLNHEFTHGLQMGGMYAAAVKLGWLAPE